MKRNLFAKWLKLSLLLMLLSITTLLASCSAAGVTTTDIGTDITTEIEQSVSQVVENLSARRQVEAAWQRARAAGAYSFDADVSQQSIPLTTVTNVGRRNVETRFYMEGDTNLSEQQLNLRLWSQGGSLFNGQGGVEIRVDGDRTFVRNGEEWEEVDDLTNLFAPDSDFMAYLAAAENIRRHADAADEGQVADGAFRPIRYTFDIDGPRFGRYLRDQIQSQMTQRGELPAGVMLEIPQQYVEMTGSGEIWLDAVGYPVRQTLDLSFPPQGDQDARIEAAVKVSFSGFPAPSPEPANALAGGGKAEGEARFGPLSATRLLANLTEMLPAPQFNGALAQVGYTLSLMAFMLALIVVIVRYRHNRRLTQVIHLAIMLSMLIAPLVNSQHTAAFYDRQAERADQQTARQEEQTARQELQAQLSQPSASQANAANLELLRNDTGADLDQDGLSDVQEGLLGTDPLVPEESAPTRWARTLSPTDPTDTDGDGLTDYEEMLLGTSPFLVDTDGDLLSDLEEIEGFRLGNTTYTTDPLSIDTNRDGIADGIEWGTDGRRDLNGNGVPNIVDFDNDGDGVIDRLDLSPSVQVTSTFTESSPLSLRVSGLAAGEITYAEFQVRPTNPDRLWYAFNVLDWPGTRHGDVIFPDDQGQIRDVDGATFYDACLTGMTMGNDCTMTPDANGDLRLLPMLEIRGGGFDNFAPTALLDRYGISTQVLENANRVAYVPLELVIDEQSGSRQAFYGKMVYEPSGHWAPQQVRLVWMVQMLTDICQGYDANGACNDYEHNVPRIVQAYYDEWRLTGFSVRENHSVEVATVFEDPAVDDDVTADQRLWQLVNGLDRSFIAARDCDSLDADGACIGDGEADIDVAEIARRFDRLSNSGVSETERWGIDNLLRVDRHDYSHLDEALVTTVQTTTRDLLTQHFNGVNAAPTLLFARTETFRAGNMELLGQDPRVAYSDGELAINLNRGEGTPLQTNATINLATYRQNTTTQSWAVLNLYEGLQALQRYGGTGDDTEIFLTQLLYLRLYDGHGRGVSFGGELLTTNTDADAILEQLNNATNLLGVGSQVVLGVVNNVLGRFLPASFDTNLLSPETQNALADVNESWGLSRSGNSNLAFAVTGLVLQGAGLALTFLNFFEFNNDILSGVSAIFFVLSGVLDVIKPVVDAALAVTESTRSLGFGTALTNKLFSISMSSAIGAGIGLVISIGVIWGAFAWQVASAEVERGTFTYDQLVATAIAATVVTILLAVIGLIAIGAILVGLVGIFDGLAYAICSFGVEDACDISITGYLTQVLASEFYQGGVVVETNTDNFVDIGQFAVQNLTPEVGYRDGAVIRLSTNITTTIRHSEPPNLDIYNIFGYGAGYYMRQTTVRYLLSVQPSEVAVTAGEMASSWNVQEDRIWTPPDLFPRRFLPLYRASAVQGPYSVDVVLDAGINVAPAVYLNIGYALPGYSSLALRGSEERIEIGNTSQLLNGLVTLDVFPRTLDEFYNVRAWSNGLFRIQDDADGDGLISQENGGNDPNDSITGCNGLCWDSDGDGLSDRLEMERSALGVRNGGIPLDPRNANTDGGVLNDLDEIRFGSNPTVVDTDGDGISDDEEFAGYQMTLPTGRVVHVFLDPTRADADGDGMSDGVERDLHLLDPVAYPFHPRVFNEGPVGLYTEIDDADGIVAPGAQVVFTTTLRNTIDARRYVDGDLSVSYPARLGGGSQSTPFLLFTDQEQQLTRSSTVTAGPSAQVNINTTADAQLRQGLVGFEWAWQSLVPPRFSSIGQTTRHATIATHIGTDDLDANSVYALAYIGPDPTIATGSLLTGPNRQSVPIGDASDDQDRAPAIACNNQRLCLLVWTELVGSGNATERKVYGALSQYDTRLLNDGYPTRKFAISTLPGNQQYPSVATDANNEDFLVVWSGPSAFSSTPTLNARMVEGRDKSQLAQRPIVPVMGNIRSYFPGATPVQRTAVDTTTDGYILAWETVSGGNVNVHAIAIVGGGLNSSLNTTVFAPHFITTGAGRNEAPKVAYDEFEDRYLVVYRHNDREIRARMVDAVGPRSDTLRIATTQVSAVSRPQVDIMPVNGIAGYGFMVGWGIGGFGADSSRFSTYRALSPDLDLRGGQFTIDWGNNIQGDTDFACSANHCAAFAVSPQRLHFTSFRLNQPNPPLGNILLNEFERLTIDADDPSVSFSMGQQAFQPGSSIVIGGTAADPSSYIDSVQVRINGGAWQPATGAESWAFMWETPTTPGNHTIEVEVTDAVGRTGLSSSTVSVDADVPSLALDPIPGGIYAPLYTETGGPALSLSGVVQDPNGIRSATVQVVPSAVGPLPIPGGAWQVDVPILSTQSTGTEISGAYTVTVQATDNAEPGGNQATLTTTVQVDARAPMVTVDLESGGIISRSVDITGDITDTGTVAAGVSALELALVPLRLLPELADPVLLLPLDETPGSRSFRDLSPNEFTAVCSGAECPTSSDGRIGNGLRFDGNDFIELGNPDALNFEGAITLAAWIKPEATNDFRDIIVHGHPAAQTFLRIRDGSYRLGSANNTNHVVIAPMPAEDLNRWVHLVGVYDGAAWRLYRDGVEIAMQAEPVGAVSVNGPWRIGAGSTNTGAGIRFFQGEIDEVTIFNRALSADAVAALYNGPRQATVDQTGPGVSASTWRYAIADGVEDYYQIDARPGDVVGNYATRRADWPIWQGEIDTRAPLLNLEVSYEGFGSSARTIYSADVTDLNLDLNGLTFLCEAQPTDRHFLDAPWWRDLAGDEERLVRLTPTCSVPGFQTAPVTLQACDLYGHCAEVTADGGTPPQQPPLRSTAILTPSHNAAFTSLDPLTIQGGSQAVNGLASVTVSVNGTQIEEIPYGAGITDSAWSVQWTPPGEGRYLLSAQVEDNGQVTAQAGQPHTITVDLNPPSLTVSMSVITTTHLVGERGLITGTVSDNVGIDRVTLSLDGAPARQAAVDEAANTWFGYWWLPQENGLFDGSSHTLTVEALDLGGYTVQAGGPITIDIVPPQAVTATLTLADGTVINPGETVTVTAPTPTISWTAPSDGSGILGVWAGWTASEVAELTDLTSYGPGAGSHTQSLGEAEIRYAHVQIVDNQGNVWRQQYGPFYFDSPATPDLVTNIFYQAWTNNDTAQIGVDRLIEQRMTGREQRLYAAWDSNALRLQWQGANWNAEGDLFLYFDTTGAAGGAPTLYNPHDDGVTVQFPVGFAPDYLVLVSQSDDARLYTWNGAWTEVQNLSSDYFLVLGDSTDLILPFTWLGITDPANTPLSLLGVASQEDELRLWAAIPDRNPLNSARVLNPMVNPEEITNFQLTQFLTLPSLGAGIRPADGVWRGDDVQARLTRGGTDNQLGYLASGLFHLLPLGTRVDPDLDGELAPELPFDTNPQPVGTGDTISYTLFYRNQGTAPATGLSLDVTTFGGLGINGGNSASFPLPDVGPGAEMTFDFVVIVDSGSAPSGELHAVLADDLRGPFDGFWSQYDIDRMPPTGLTVDGPPYIGPRNMFVGRAMDSSGVTAVQLSLLLQPRNETIEITCPVDMPIGGTWSCLWPAGDVSDLNFVAVRMRAVDRYGNISPWVDAAPELFVDNTPPTVSFDNISEGALVDGVIAADELTLSGLVVDNRLVTQVNICLALADNEQCNDVSLQGRDPMTATWQTILPGDVQEGITATLTLYGMDKVANRSLPISRTFQIDTTPPQAAVLTETVTVDLATYWAEEMALLEGTISDGAFDATLYVGIEGPGTLPTLAIADQISNTWRFRPLLREAGVYTFTLEAWDLPGNSMSLGQYVVTATGEAPAIAIDFRWDGGGDGVNWLDPANWQPDGLPTDIDRVLLDSNVTGEIRINGRARVSELTLPSGYTGTLSLDGGELSVAGNFLQTDGTLLLNNGRLRVGGDFNVTGGSFEPGNGQVILTPTGEQTLVAPTLNTLVLGDGPTSHWKLDEGSGRTVRDSSGSNHTGIGVGGVGWGEGAGRVANNGSALTLNGVNGYVTLPGGNELGLVDSSFSVSAWINGTEFGTGDRTILGNDSGAQYQGLHLVIRNGRPYMGFIDSAVTSPTAIQPNQWNHLVFRYDLAQRTLAIYVNGELVVSGTDRHPFQGTAPVYIGRWSNGNYFNGRIDDVRIYDRPLTDAEIQALTNGDHRNGLAGHWPLDEGSGIVTADVSGHALNGTLTNGPTWSADAPGTTFSNTASLSFDGVNDRVVLPIGGSAGQFQNNFTVAGWIKPTNLSGARRIISADRSSAGLGWGFGTQGAGLRFTTYGIRDYDTGTVSLTPGVWTHVVAVMGSNNAVTFYVNGVVAETIAGAVPARPAGNRRMVLGSLGLENLEFFAGQMDDVRVYDHVLSADEIASLAAGENLPQSLGSVTLGAPLMLNESLILNDAVLDVNATESFSITLRGDFRGNGGGFLPRNGDVIFAGNGAQIVDARGITFNNVTVANGSEGLVGQWSLDEFVGGRSPDATQFGNTATLAGGPAVVAPSPAGGQALSFDGLNDRVALGNPGVLNFSGRIAIAAWIRPTATNGIRNIVAHGHHLSPNAEVALRINNGRYEVLSWNGTNHLVSADIPAGDLNNWVHLVGVYDGTFWQLYRNGVQIAVGSRPVGAVTVNSDWAIGARGTGTERFFQGDIDEVRIYNRALTAAEVASLAGGAAARSGEGVLTTLNEEAGGVTLASQLHIAGELMLESGTLDASGGDNELKLEGNLMAKDGRFNARNGTVSFAGSGEQRIEAPQITFGQVAVMENVELQTETPIMRTGELTSEGLIVETRRLDGAPTEEYPGTVQLHYGLADISLDVVEPGSFESMQVTRIDDDSANASPTTRTGRYWLFDASGENFLVDLSLGHDNVANPGVCQHLGNGEWDFYNDSATGDDVTRTGVTSLDGEWAVGFDPNATMSLYLPLVSVERAESEEVAGQQQLFLPYVDRAAPPTE